MLRLPLPLHLFLFLPPAPARAPGMDGGLREIVSVSPFSVVLTPPRAYTDPVARSPFPRNPGPSNNVQAAARKLPAIKELAFSNSQIGQVPRTNS